MPTALFLSPHLDDAVFSCGGVAALLADRGWRTVLATVFTRTVLPVHGFALACQLDKGLTPEVDYMALRREEDQEAAAIIGFSDVRWMDLPEAPHRGYESAPALFQDRNEVDGVQVALQAGLFALAAELAPALVFAPQGLGNHVDHQHVTAAAQVAFGPGRLAYWRDTPYAMRREGSAALPFVPRNGDVAVPIAPALDRKIAAAQAYASQIGYQFGGAEALAAALRRFALLEGGGQAAERLCGEAAALAAEAVA